MVISHLALVVERQVRYAHHPTPAPALCRPAVVQRHSLVFFTKPKRFGRNTKG